MGKERRKEITAGSLWMGVQYAAAYTPDPDARRQAKAMISTPARESLNARKSWQKLMLILACNFRPGDLVVTLTYREQHLPRTREDADKQLTGFIRALRKKRGVAGTQLKYIRVTEGYHTGGRLHHHLILNTTQGDFETIRSLWRWGDDVDITHFGADGAERWAKYLTKEPRVLGRRYVGDRTWRASLHMIKPQILYSFVDTSQALSPPPGAVIIERIECQNSYGRFVSLIAAIPPACKNSGLG